MPKTVGPPAYCRRCIRGKVVAYVTLTDPGTGARKDCWLGPYGSDESRERYARRLIREAMVRGNPRATPNPRKPWSREIANRFTRHLIAIFNWGVAHELVSPQVYEALRTLEPLRRGRPDVREMDPVWPVPDAFVDAAEEYMLPQVRAMVELQRCTGMRPGEVVIMRTRDLETTGLLWVYTPAHHKTAHFGHERKVYLGPMAQEILRHWLRTNLDEYLFQPREAVAWSLEQKHAARKTPFSGGNRPGTNRKEALRRTPGECYDMASYRRAITRACDLADQAAREKATAEGRTVFDNERLVPRWHPHQLRHNFATQVRQKFGVEAASNALGHQHVAVTEVYAERDQMVAATVAQMMG